MEKKTLVIMNHVLNNEQLNAWKGGEIHYLPEDLKNIWANIDPEGNATNVQSLQDIIKFASNFDNVIVAGEGGALVYIVSKLEKMNIGCYYATTRRDVKEEVKEDGTVLKKSIFKHVSFKRYILA